jgi:hypothetical protein
MEKFLYYLFGTILILTFLSFFGILISGIWFGFNVIHLKVFLTSILTFILSIIAVDVFKQ